MKPSRNKVIITCAITGSVHTPSMSPHLPVTPDEIARSAIEAAEAGAAIVHLHARQPDTGQPTQDPALYAQFLPRIKAASDVVINITTGGSPVLPLADRMAPALRFKPEVASLNMGSMNFGMYELLERFKTFSHTWERPYLEGSNDLIFKNTFKDIEHILTTCGDNGTRFEIECYDIGIGLSREEAVANLGTIARSGTREFFSQLTGDKQKDAQLIGQFGVGFYSSFIVADKVTVISRRAGATDAIRWESDGQGRCV